MTKQEELKLLEQIEGLILSAGTDSYIHDTFAGIVNICRNNIVNDFGDHPVQDLEIERERGMKKDAEMGAEINRLEHERDALQKNLDSANEHIELLKKTSDAWERNAVESGELYCELEKECSEKDAEIMRLKAELYDYMRKEREQ